MAKVIPPQLSFAVGALSVRARSTPRAAVVSVAGQHGHSGYHGAAGWTGRYGGQGMDAFGHGGSGGPGGRGGDGGHGKDGSDATNATSSRNVSVVLTTNDKLDSMIITTNPFEDNGAQKSVTEMTLVNQKGSLLVAANGGWGGRGGDGGDGGAGGDGGRGGRGGHGSHGHHAHGAGHNGGRGGDGGPGGSGGNGGDGGSGGIGGNGGSGGNGGQVVVSTSEPKLLMFCEVDAAKGRAGAGGRGGSAGRAGHGGSGGSGGSGGPGGHGGPAETRQESQRQSDGRYVTRTVTVRSAGSSGFSGSMGRSGFNGQSGRSGNSGRSGRAGQDGVDGAIQFLITDENGRVIEQAPDRYHAAVQSYTMTDENEDGIYEPNTLIRVTNVHWCNIGAMTMPAGAYVSFPSNATVFSQGQSALLPDCKVGGTLPVEHLVNNEKEFLLRLPDAAPVHGLQPFKREHQFSSVIKLLGRAFPASIVPTKLTSRYPIEFSGIQVTPILGPGEISKFTFTLSNVSNSDYGADYAGSIAIAIWCDSNLIITPPASATDTYQLTGNQGCVVFVPRIAAHSSVTISIPFTCSMATCSKLFEDLYWKLELQLRKKPIQFLTGNIRVTPVFLPLARSDVILVTDAKHVDRSEFLAWTYLLQLLGLSVNFWDLQRYRNAFWAADMTWIGLSQLVIFPVYERFDPRSVRFADVQRHFQLSPDNGFLFLGPTAPNLDELVYDYNTIIKDEQAWKGKACCTPSAEDILNAADPYRREYELRDDGTYMYQMVIDPSKLVKECIEVKYGNYQIVKSTLPTNRLLVCSAAANADGANAGSGVFRRLGGGHLPFEYDTKTFSAKKEREVQVNSSFGATLISVVAALPLIRTLHLLSVGAYVTSLRFTWVRQGGQTFSDIIAAQIYSIVKREFEQGSNKFDQIRAAIDVVAVKLQSVQEQYQRENVVRLFHAAIQRQHDDTMWSAFPWCCASTVAVQRKSLADVAAYARKTLGPIPGVADNGQTLRTIDEVAHISFASSNRRAPNVRYRDVAVQNSASQTKSVADFNQQQTSFGAGLVFTTGVVAQPSYQPPPIGAGPDMKDQKHMDPSMTAAGGAAGAAVGGSVSPSAPAKKYFTLAAEAPPLFYQVKTELPPPPQYVAIADVKLSAADADLGLPPAYEDKEAGPASPAAAAQQQAPPEAASPTSGAAVASQMAMQPQPQQQQPPQATMQQQYPQQPMGGAGTVDPNAPLLGAGRSDS